MNKVLFIANIGIPKKTATNGVSVKNRHILKYLDNMENTEVTLINTANWKLRIAQLILKILVLSFTNNKIVLSIDTNSAYKVIKFLNMFRLEKKLLYFVVGGSLPTKITKGTLKTKYFKNIFKIFVQTTKMEKELKELGMDNIERLPNSKYFEEINVDEKKKINIPIKCFYLGRIHPDKGIDMIFESLKQLNTYKQKFVVDFYGLIEKSYKDSFMTQVNKCNFANYNGIIDLIDNIENYYRLSRYDLFLFPTYWQGEGFPGVVIDSFISGVPVVASDWNHNCEVIENGYNGLIFEVKNIKDLIDKMNYIYKNKDILLEMQKNAHKSSRNYKTENVLKNIGYLIDY